MIDIRPSLADVCGCGLRGRRRSRLSTPALIGAKRGTRLAGGVFVLANTILGAGMLGLPRAFAECGWLPAPLLLMCFGAFSTAALIMLSECADAIGRPSNIAAVAEAAVPGFGALFDVAIAIKCFGVATSYLVVVGDSVPQAMVAFGGTGPLLERRVWVLVALAFGAPLAYMERITALRHTSLVALSCVLLITVMVVLFALHPGPPFVDPCLSSSQACRGHTAVVTSTESTLRALPLFVFSFTCHQNAISVTNEIAAPTRARCWSLCAASIGVALVVYSVLASAGYATFGDLVQPNVLHSYPAGSLLVAVARVMISLVVMCCYPLQAHPSRACVSTILNRLAGIGHSSGLHMSLTTAFVLSTGSIALVVSDLGLVLSVVGATGSTIVTYVLPGACYYVLFPCRRSRYAGLALLTTGACFICPVSMYLIFHPQALPVPP